MHPSLTSLLFAARKAAVVVIATAILPLQWSAALEPDSSEFFEQKIRPVLVKHCYECHSETSDELGGSLWLDSAEAMRIGGDSGPVVQPGDAEASVLISALRYESSEMPPDQPLAPQVIDDFVRWIDAGAQDPRVAKTGAMAEHLAQDQIDLEQGRKFWAFRPLADFRQLATSDRQRLPDSALIDDLINHELQRQGIRSNDVAAADARLRRLSFDLTGLPPSDSVRKRWRQTSTQENWAIIVDELIDSREFAQHWARHWMDVARYADSNGSDFNATFHDAWRYRDYLIDSFDQDRPLDEMIRQQVAGDLLPAESETQRYDNIVATTFLMLGAKMLSERDKPKLILDVVDEQIDTIGRAFLGMTLGCARCHDHKFDPIPTEDYYALAGILKSTQTLNGESQKYVSTWNKVELPTSEKHRQELRRHREELTALEKAVKAASKRLQAAKSLEDSGMVVDDVDAVQTGSWVKSTFTKGFVGVGYIHDNNSNKGQFSVEFRKRLPTAGDYLVRFAFNTSGNRAAKVPVTIRSAEGVNEQFVSQRTASETPPWKTLGTFSFTAEDDAVVTIRNEGTDGYVIVDAISFVPVDNTVDEQRREQIDDQISTAQQEHDRLTKRLETLKRNAPRPLPQAMAPRDLPDDQIMDSPVHIRGEVKNLGEAVPRGFLQVCGPGDASIAAPQGSGRLELAYWLTDPDNPLVARVMVNRIWMHLFGEGIVRTVDNFGARGQSPSHPELLDALAIDFMSDGWRLKPLVRRIVLSEAYNRSSDPNPDASQADPENRLLWRAHRKRISAESIRDSMLFVAGALTDEERTEPVGDKGVLVTKNNGDTKAVASGIDQPVRSIYLPVIRGNLAPLMTALDAADPDLLVGKRPTTNVPGQALVLINSEEVNRWAEQTAQRIITSEDNWPDRLAAVFEICLSREATSNDLEIAEHYVGVSGADDEDEVATRFGDFVAAVFAATEFRLLD